MSARLRRGGSVAVRVPGSSANLGPGYDSLGLALAVHDVVEVVAVEGPRVEVQVEGEGADRIATGETNLVVRSIRAALARVVCPVELVWGELDTAAPLAVAQEAAATDRAKLTIVPGAGHLIPTVAPEALRAVIERRS